MPSKKIEVQGLIIRIEKIQENDFVSLTDIAKKVDEEPRFTIRNWMRNNQTLEFLEVWEAAHNPDFKRAESGTFRLKANSNNFSTTPQKWIKATNAKGLISKSGKYGGTYAHRDIALNFCYWLSPTFQVFFIKAFQQLIEEAFDRKNLEWHVTKVTDLLDEARNWMDTIPGQEPSRIDFKGIWMKRKIKLKKTTNLTPL